jgi:hypothetical protein
VQELSPDIRLFIVFLSRDPTHSARDDAQQSGMNIYLKVILYRSTEVSAPKQNGEGWRRNAADHECYDIGMPLRDPFQDADLIPDLYATW